jgi:hypothetical protein
MLMVWNPWVVSDVLILFQHIWPGTEGFDRAGADGEEISRFNGTGTSL